MATCAACSIDFVDAANHAWHLRLVHPTEEDERRTRRNVCEECGFTSSSVVVDGSTAKGSDRVFAFHVRFVHGKEDPFELIAELRSGDNDEDDPDREEEEEEVSEDEDGDPGSSQSSKRTRRKRCRSRTGAKSGALKRLQNSAEEEDEEADWRTEKPKPRRKINTEPQSFEPEYPCGFCTFVSKYRTSANRHLKICKARKSFSAKKKLFEETEETEKEETEDEEGETNDNGQNEEQEVGNDENGEISIVIDKEDAKKGQGPMADPTVTDDGGRGQTRYRKDEKSVLENDKDVRKGKESLKCAIKPAHGKHEVPKEILKVNSGNNKEPHNDKLGIQSRGESGKQSSSESTVEPVLAEGSNDDDDIQIIPVVVVAKHQGGNNAKTLKYKEQADEKAQEDQQNFDTTIDVEEEHDAQVVEDRSVKEPTVDRSSAGVVASSRGQSSTKPPHLIQLTSKPSVGTRHVIKLDDKFSRSLDKQRPGSSSSSSKKSSAKVRDARRESKTPHTELGTPTDRRSGWITSEDRTESHSKSKMERSAPLGQPGVKRHLSGSFASVSSTLHKSSDRQSKEKGSRSSTSRQHGTSSSSRKAADSRTTGDVRTFHGIRPLATKDGEKGERKSTTSKVVKLGATEKRQCVPKAGMRGPAIAEAKNSTKSKGHTKKEESSSRNRRQTGNQSSSRDIERQGRSTSKVVANNVDEFSSRRARSRSETAALSKSFSGVTLKQNESQVASSRKRTRSQAEPENKKRARTYQFKNSRKGKLVTPEFDFDAEIALCEYCDFSTLDPYALKRHKKVEHKREWEGEVAEAKMAAQIAAAAAEEELELPDLDIPPLAASRSQSKESYVCPPCVFECPDEDNFLLHCASDLHKTTLRLVVEEVDLVTSDGD